MKTTIEKLQLNGLDIDGEISSKLSEYSPERKRHIGIESREKKTWNYERNVKNCIENRNILIYI